MKATFLSLMATLAFASVTPAKATVIAVIDSGTDLSHPDLVHHMWTNPIDIDDAVDNDDNGYIDDIHGWNFAENNNKLYDKSLLGTFSPELNQYFAYQTKALRGTATADEIAWLKAKVQDESFIAQLETFANFVHGTHVAGIVSKDVPNAQVMVLKIMATKRPTIGHGFDKAPTAACSAKVKVPDAVIKAGLKLLASQQGKQMVPFGQYVNMEKARVANCSFGISVANAKTMLKPIISKLTGCEPSDDQITSYASYFVSQALDSQKVLATSAPNTLFVIAAGNDGTDNDVLPASPANLRLDNTITVAATMDYTKIASFSNYGKTMVDVAAPGVGIRSTIPGGEYLTVSGTSQASPFVANVAGQILDAEPTLTNAEVKQILMGTVDLKPFLHGKVASQGIVNPNRAVMAAKVAKTMGMEAAINSARAQVADVAEKAVSKNNLMPDYEGYVMPLPTLFE